MKKFYSMLIALLAALTANAAGVTFTLTIDDPSTVELSVDYEPYKLEAGANEISTWAWTSISVKAVNDNFLKSVVDTNTGEELYLNSLTECSFFAKNDYEGHNITITTFPADEVRTASVVVNVDNASKVRIQRTGTDTEVNNLQNGRNVVRYIPGTEPKLKIASAQGGNVQLNAVQVGGVDMVPTGNVYYISLPCSGDINVLAEFPAQECTVTLVCNEGAEDFITRITADDADVDFSSRSFTVDKGAVLKIYGDMDTYSCQFFNIGEQSITFASPMTYCVTDDVTFTYGAIRYSTYKINLDLDCAENVVVYRGLKNMGAPVIEGLVDGINEVEIAESSGVICIDAAPGAYILNVFKGDEAYEPNYIYGFYTIDELSEGTNVVVKSAKIERDLSAIVYIDSDPAEVTGFELRNKGGDLVRCQAGYNVIEFYEGDNPFSLNIIGAAADYRVLLNGDVIEKNWKGVHSLTFEPDHVAKVFLTGAPTTHRVVFEIEGDADNVNIIHDMVRVVEDFERPLTVHAGTHFRIFPAGDDALAVSLNGQELTADEKGEFTFVPTADANTVSIKVGTDGIESIEADATAGAAVYNLQGVAVSSDLETLPAGLYISGGRKIIKK